MWQGEVFKSIFFPAGPPKPAGEIWQLATGALPENVQNKGLPPPLLSTASGDWNGWQIAIGVQPNRIEINLTNVDPAPSSPAPIPPIPLDRVDNAIAALRQITDIVAKDMPITRFGAAGQFVQPAPSLEAAVAIINANLASIFPDDADSILYQLNRRTDLRAVDGSVMNRLCKWGVAVLNTLGIAVDQSGNVVKVPGVGEPVHYAYLHLDMNNNPFDQPIAGAEMKSMIDELWSEVIKIRDGGRNAL